MARPHPELEEIASYFRQALADAGYPSLNAFLLRHPFDKNRLYGLLSGERFLTLEACRAVTVALGHPADEVDPIWWRTKQAMERAAAEDDHRPITSWAELPWPSAALRDILDAQAQAVDLLPYRLLGVQAPPLSTVYVRQQARSQSTAAKSERKDARTDLPAEREPVSPEQAIPVTDAFERHEHLILTGEPGAGKSTFGQYLALRLSEIWLRTSTAEHPLVAEPVVPIRVPARSLVGARSWAAGLAAAAQATLGLRLVAEPQPALFERRPLGARWLVIIDGLDEIVDRAARTEVIQAIAARCRAGSDYRIVVTTRQLPDAEFALLRSPHSQTYAFEPFGREELKQFATQWFAAQGSGDAGRFLRQTDDGRLRELVRNPLLATIAATSYSLDPGRTLPRSRLTLYERIIEHLLDEDSGGRATLAEQRRMYASRPDCQRFVEWLHEGRRDLLRHLAGTRLDGESPLLEAALAWVDEHRPAELDRLSRRPDDIRATLLGTGLMVDEVDHLRFLHHSFAEFLAAEAHAAEVGPEFTGLESWITKGMRPAEQNGVIFLFAQWCRRPGHDPARVLDRLQLGNPERVLLAGRLLAELTQQPAESRRQVLDRLFGLLLYHSIRVENGAHSDPGASLVIAQIDPERVADVLGEFVDDLEVIERLRLLADDRRLPQPTRLAMIRALGRCDGPDAALDRLTDLAGRLDDFERLSAARLAVTLGAAETLGRELLVQLCADERVSSFVRAEASAELSTLGQSDVAGPVARGQVLGGRLPNDHLRRSVETWLRPIPLAGGERAAAAEAIEEADFTARQKAAVAEALIRVDLLEQADRLAWSAMQDVAEIGWAIESLIGAWMRPDHRLLPEFAALIRRAGDPRTRAEAAVGLAAAGCADEAYTQAMELIAEPKTDGYSISLAIKACLAGRRDVSPDLLLDQLRRRPITSMRWLDNSLEAFTEAGHPAITVQLAKEGLADRATEAWDVDTFVTAWISAEGPQAADEIMDQLTARGDLSTRTRTEAARALAWQGCREASQLLAGDLVERPDLDTFELTRAAEMTVLETGPPGAEKALRLLESQDRSTVDRIAVAEHTAAAGHLSAAHRMWCSVLLRPAAPLGWLTVAAGRLVSSGGADLALAALEKHPAPAIAARAGLILAAARAEAERG